MRSRTTSFTILGGLNSVVNDVGSLRTTAAKDGAKDNDSKAAPKGRRSDDAGRPVPLETPLETALDSTIRRVQHP
jgi:hypothetical protein